MSVFVLGINHKTASIGTREKFMVPEEREAELIGSLDSDSVVRERAVLSTCNRTEIYGVTDEPEAAYGCLMRGLSRYSCLPQGQFADNVYFMTDQDSVAHLFSVASGLDSLALGETEILGQVKSAYAKAHANGSTGPVLNTLFQRSIAVGKKVRTETEIGSGKVSVASIAIDLATKIFDDLHTKRIMLVGSGEVARLVCEALLPRAPRRFMIANRSVDKATELAAAFRGEVVAFDAIDEHMVETDILISSIAVPTAAIGKARAEGWMKRKRGRALFIIDLGAPRNVEPAAGEIEDVYLYNIDDLRSIADRGIAARESAAAECRQIISKATVAYMRRITSGSRDGRGEAAR